MHELRCAACRSDSAISRSDASPNDIFLSPITTTIAENCAGLILQTLSSGHPDQRSVNKIAFDGYRSSARAASGSLSVRTF